MLAAGNLLNALNDTEYYKCRNEDHALSDVLDYFSDDTTKYKLRYSDGTEDYFSFDN